MKCYPKAMHLFGKASGKSSGCKPEIDPIVLLSPLYSAFSKSHEQGCNGLC